MSTFFSANQYENGYDPKRMGNWEIPHSYIQRPKQNEGFTQILANDRGHILPYVKRSPANPWGNFVGTWQMPNKLPGPKYNLATSRAEKSQIRLAVQAEASQHFTSGQDKNDLRRIITDRRKQDYAQLPPIESDRRSPRRPLSGSGSPGGAQRSLPPTPPQHAMQVTMNVSDSPRDHSPIVYPKTHYPLPEDVRELTPLSNPSPPQESQSPLILPKGGGVASPIRVDPDPAHGSSNDGSPRPIGGSPQANEDTDVTFAL